MSSLNDLKWSDIKSNTMNENEYLNYIKQKGVYSNYKNYQINKDKLDRLKQKMDNDIHLLRIFAIGADWCPDCSKQLPALIKIIQEFGTPFYEIKILYGVKKNAFHKGDESPWHKRHSPPEATNPKFNLIKIPTIYFFNEDGNLLGRIVEKPKCSNTLEEEIWEIIKN
ncbi:MAG: thioredoxin family protein [Candidatus Lokiarchaeota archaeon]